MPDASTQLGRVEPAGGRGRRWWQDARWIAAGLAVLCVGGLLWGLFGPEPPITVSPATTFLTAPLAADGLPDYGAALLAAQGPAPRPEDNAVVELLQVLWPMGIDPPDLPLVCKALGIPPTPPADVLQAPPLNAATKVTADMFKASYGRPWTGAEFPALEAWVVAHEAALDRLVAAADRPRWWRPSRSSLRPRPRQTLFEELWLPENDTISSVARMLCCRAMWHAAAGRHAAAWRDLRAVYRLDRLLAAPTTKPQSLLTHLRLFGNDALADTALPRGLLGAADLSAEVLAEIRRDLDALGPLGSADVLEGERLASLDACLYVVARTGGGGRRLAAFAEPPPGVLGLGLLTSLDRDVMLRQVNAWYDAAEAAAKLPTHAAREAAWARVEQTFGSAGRDGVWRSTGIALVGFFNRGYRSAMLGREFNAVWSRSKISVTCDQTRFALARTAAALAAWKADRAAGEAPYPETLSALVPRYLPAEPLDPFSDKPFIYERRGDGYLLASVGENGSYDGGDDREGWIIGGEWQRVNRDVKPWECDHVVRMPVPPVPASAPAP